MMPLTENGMQFINTAAEEAGSYQVTADTHPLKRFIFQYVA